MALSIPSEFRTQYPALTASAEAAFRSDSLDDITTALSRLPDTIAVTTVTGKCRGHAEADIERYTESLLRDALRERCRVLATRSGVESTDYRVHADMKTHSPVAFGMLHVFTFGVFSGAHALVTCRQGYCSYKHYDWATDCPHITRATSTVSLAAAKSQLRTRVVALQLAKERQEAARREQEQRERQERERAARERDERLRREEQERLRRERERLERERQEKLRREQERQERERAERERVRREQERQERERAERERVRREQERQERERAERERVRREQAELEAAGARRRQAQQDRRDKQQQQDNGRQHGTHFGQAQAHVVSPRNGC